MYILQCADDSYYTGSTKYLEKRVQQHQNGEGANHTKNRLPVILVYAEYYPRIDLAFNREKQVQGWSRKKKEALINGEHHRLPELAKAYRDKVVSSASTTSNPSASTTSNPSVSTTSNPSASTTTMDVDSRDVEKHPEPGLKASNDKESNVNVPVRKNSL